MPGARRLAPVPGKTSVSPVSPGAGTSVARCCGSPGGAGEHRWTRAVALASSMCQRCGSRGDAGPQQRVIDAVATAICLVRRSHPGRNPGRAVSGSRSRPQSPGSASRTQRRCPLAPGGGEQVVGAPVPWPPPERGLVWACCPVAPPGGAGQVVGAPVRYPGLRGGWWWVRRFAGLGRAGVALAGAGVVLGWVFCGARRAVVGSPAATGGRIRGSVPSCDMWRLMMGWHLASSLSCSCIRTVRRWSGRRCCFCW